jgi:hypothetical protein
MHGVRQIIHQRLMYYLDIKLDLKVDVNRVDDHPVHVHLCYMHAIHQGLLGRNTYMSAGQCQRNSCCAIWNAERQLTGSPWKAGCVHEGFQHQGTEGSVYRANHCPPFIWLSVVVRESVRQPVTTAAWDCHPRR